MQNNHIRSKMPFLAFPTRFQRAVSSLQSYFTLLYYIVIAPKICQWFVKKLVRNLLHAFVCSKRSSVVKLV